jgi:hypothetical protein
MTATTSRRAVLAGAASIPVLGVQALAAGMTPDPIFAAIEKHRALYIESLKARKIYSVCSFDDPTEPEKDAAVQATWCAVDDAGTDLTEVEPTTLAGVIALLLYVQDFNGGKIDLPETRGLDRTDRWKSEPVEWPTIREEDDPSDSGTNMFAFDLLANVHEALKAIAGRAS